MADYYLDVLEWTAPCDMPDAYELNAGQAEL